MAKIYRQSRAIGDLFTVVHYMEGKRSRQAFSDLGDAVEAAEKIAARIARGDREALKVTDKDWQIYSMASVALRPTATAIDAACREYAEARKILGSTPLLEAARYFVRHNDEEIIDLRPCEGTVQIHREAVGCCGCGNDGGG